MYGECRDIQVRAVVHEHREVGQACCKKGEYEADDPEFTLGPNDLKDRSLVVLPNAEWMKRKLNYTDETLKSMEVYCPDAFAWVTEHLPENERAAILFLIDWEISTDDCIWSGKNDCWIDRFSHRKRPV
jgi:hypothetical protein